MSAGVPRRRMRRSLPSARRPGKTRMLRSPSSTSLSSLSESVVMMRCRRTSDDIGTTAMNIAAEEDEEADQPDQRPEPRLLDERPAAVSLTSSSLEPAISFTAVNVEHGACQLELKRRSAEGRDRRTQIMPSKRRSTAGEYRQSPVRQGRPLCSGLEREPQPLSVGRRLTCEPNDPHRARAQLDDRETRDPD